MSQLETPQVRHATRAIGHPVWRALLWAVAAVAGFGIVLTQTAVQQLESRIETYNLNPQLGDDRPAPALPPEDGAKGLALNILLMGSDSRDGGNEFIGGFEAGQRSDTTLIMHISADRTRVELLSFPRDSMVQLAECTRSDGSVQKTYFGMINEAFANGAKTGSKADAAVCTIETIESLTDIRINHWAIVDMAGFSAMITAVGGVPMCIPEDVKDKYTSLELKAGPQVLDGWTATQYARMRHGSTMDGSDLQRIDNQQILLKNLARKVIGTEVLFRPTDLVNFISAAAASVAMDSQLGDIDGYAAGLLLSMRDFDPHTGMVMATVPVRTYAPNPAKVEFTSAAADVFAAMANDEPILPYLDSNSASPANDPQAGQAPSPTAGTDGNSAMRESEDEILAACG